MLHINAKHIGREVIMERRFRPRKEFKFWLYHDLPEQVKLMEYIDYLRKTRQFAMAVRNGLRLLWTLGEGDLSVLFELFPTLRSQFAAPGSQTPPDGFQQLLEDAARKGAQLALMQAPALPAPPVGYPVLQPATASVGGSLPIGGTGNLKLGGGRSLEITMPSFDEDEEETLILKKSGHDPMEGWLDRIFAMQASMGNAEITDERIKPREFKKHGAGLIEDQLVEKRAVPPDDEQPATKQGRGKDKGAKLQGLQPMQ